MLKPNTWESLNQILEKDFFQQRPFVPDPLSLTFPWRMRQWWGPMSMMSCGEQSINIGFNFEVIHSGTISTLAQKLFNNLRFYQSKEWPKPLSDPADHLEKQGREKTLPLTFRRRGPWFCRGARRRSRGTAASRRAGRWAGLERAKRKRVENGKEEGGNLGDR